MALFYSKGLKFRCKRCSDCCRHEPGYVFLRKSDLLLLEKALKKNYNEIMDTCCRWIPSENGIMRLSLREKSNYDCIFWENGCSVYEYRPIQCKSYPFWPSSLASQRAWNETASLCPGINKGGEIHSAEKINAWLEMQKAEKPMEQGF